MFLDVFFPMSQPGGCLNISTDQTNNILPQDTFQSPQDFRLYIGNPDPKFPNPPQ